MQHILKRRRFVPEDLQLSAVQSFWCGNKPWEREVADWITNRAEEGVLHNMKHYGCDVWLYMTQDDVLVGFGSLGRSRWRWPEPHSNRVSISLIPMLGIKHEFHGKPDGVPIEDHYSTQILDDLIEEASEHHERHPLLGLFVHPQNTKAIDFYARHGFEPFTLTFWHEEFNVDYISMIRDLVL